MRKWLFVVMFLTVLFTHSEKVEASSNKENTSSTDKLTLTKDYLEGIWGNQDGFVCEFHSGDFIGFPKKTSTYLETYNYQIVNNTIKLRQAGTYVCKLSIKVINADCIQINGIKAYRAGSKKADDCQSKLQKAFLGNWFDCDLSDFLHDERWEFTNDTAFHSYTVAGDDESFEKLENPYFIHEFQFYYSGDLSPYYIRSSKDELTLYRNSEEIHLLRMNSDKLKGFLNGDNIFADKYVVKDSLYTNELIEVSFVDDTKEPVDLNDPDKLAMECKFSWDGHEMTMTLGDAAYKIYLYGQQRTLVLGGQELTLVPEDWKYVKEYKRNKKIQMKNGNVESRTYTFSSYDQNAVKYLKLSFKYQNNIVLNDYIYGESSCMLSLYPMGTYGDAYRIESDLDIKNGKITLVYRPEYLKYNCENDLAIAYSRKYDGTPTILKSTIDSKNHTVTAKYCGEGYYQLIDRVLVEGGTHDRSQENLMGNAWVQGQETGDILKLVDLDYLHSSDGHFKVSNASELATAVYYANTINAKAVIELTDDIDLSTYEWAAVGYDSTYYGLSHPFKGEIIGNHHKITGLTIHSSNYCTGFVGLAEDCTISDLMIEDAKISGIHTSAVLVGNVQGGVFKNCNVSGSVIGSNVGSMFGYEDGIFIEQCTANVTVNGKEFNFLSKSESERSKYVIKDLIQLTINDEHVIQGSDKSQYHYMKWVVYLNGHRIAEQEVLNNLEYKCDTTKKGEYIVYLEGLFGDYFIPVSNKIAFKIE